MRLKDLKLLISSAHLIRNRKSQMAKAVCALKSHRRWVVTGTPIQNRLSDISTLFEFLQIYPYHEIRNFETDISSIWKAGDQEEAIKRLKLLLGCVMLRRSKGTIKLPKRTDRVNYLDFTHAEQELYEKLKRETIGELSTTVDGDSKFSFFNVLICINSLRMMCNLGLNYQLRDILQIN